MKTGNFGKKVFPLVFLFCSLSGGFALGKPQQGPAPDPSMDARFAAEEVPEHPAISPPERPDRAEQVMRAFAAAYPDRVGEARFINGDWAVPVGRELYYYAEGRLLPEALRDRFEDYDPQPFYSYPPELPPWKEPGPEETERIRGAAGRRRANPPKRSQHFWDALWRARTREESYERVKTIRFFGHEVLVHYAVMEELALAEERIRGEAKTSLRVQQWINELSLLSGWNWRSIADTESRSFHAYGVAVDFLPRSQRGLATYWLWTAEHNDRWWAVPYARRLHPPDEVIRAFESCGFIWGGKWLFFDTMHFEYRPEILLLNGMAPVSDLP
jgi:hypothetical protein